MAQQTKRKKPAQNMYVIPALRQKEETMSHLPHKGHTETKSEASFYHVITHISEDWTSSSSEEDFTMYREVSSVVKETNNCFNSDSNKVITTEENCHTDRENLIVTKKNSNCHGVRTVVVDNEKQQTNRVVSLKKTHIPSSESNSKQTGKQESLRITSTKNSSIMSDLDIYQMTRSLVLKEKYLVKEKGSYLDTGVYLSQMSPNAAEFKLKDIQESKYSRTVITAEKESTTTTSELNKTCVNMTSELDTPSKREITLINMESSKKFSVNDSEINRPLSKSLYNEDTEWIRTVSFKDQNVTGPSKMIIKGLTHGGLESDKGNSNDIECSKSNGTPSKDLNCEVTEWSRTISFKDSKVTDTGPGRTPSMEHSNIVVGSKSDRTSSKNSNETTDATSELKNAFSVLSFSKDNKTNSDTKYKSPTSPAGHAFSQELSCSDVKKNLLKDLSVFGSEARHRNISQDSGISVSSYDVSNTDFNISMDSGNLTIIPKRRPHSTTKDYINIMKTENTIRMQDHLLLNGVKNLSTHIKQKNSKKLKKMVAFRDLLTRAVKGQKMTENECLQLFKYIMIRIWKKRSYRQLAKICADIIKKHHDKSDKGKENQSGLIFPKILLECCEDLINDFPSVKKQHHCHWRDFLSFLKVLYQEVHDLSKGFPKCISQTLTNAGYITS